MRWVGVVALWTIVIGGSWVTTEFKSAEERQVDRLCERYEDLRGSPIAEIRDQLTDLLPTDWDANDLNETIEMCAET